MSRSGLQIEERAILKAAGTGNQYCYAGTSAGPRWFIIARYRAEWNKGTGRGQNKRASSRSELYIIAISKSVLVWIYILILYKDTSEFQKI